MDAKHTQTVWKFELLIADVQVVAMPRFAEILCVQPQHGQPCLWARVWPETVSEARTIYTVGTGHPMPEECGRYIGTIQQLGGSLVWHYFEAKS